MKFLSFLTIYLLSIGYCFAQNPQLPIFEKGLNQAGNGWMVHTGLVTDVQNNVYVAGYFVGQRCIGDTCVFSTGPEDIDALIFSVDSSQNLRWVRTFGSPRTDRVFDMQIGPDGNLYLAGGFSDTVQLGAHTLIGKDNAANVGYTNSQEGLWWIMNTDGDYLEAHMLGGEGVEELTQISVATNGRVAVGGNSISRELCNQDGSFCFQRDSIQHFYSHFLVLYTQDHIEQQHIHLYSHDSIHSGTFNLGETQVYEDGRILYGHRSSPFIRMVDSVGREIWAIHFDAGYGSDPFLSNPGTGITMAFEVNQPFSLQGYDVLAGYVMLQLDELGRVRWLKSVSTPATFNFTSLIQTDSVIYGYGYLWAGELSLGAYQLQMSRNGLSDLIVVAHKAGTGEVLWAKKITDTPGVDEAAGIGQMSITSQQRLVVSGAITELQTKIDSVDFLNPDVGSSLGFLAWSTIDSLALMSVGIEEVDLIFPQFSLSPNPATDEMNIGVAEFYSPTGWEIVDIAGRIMMSGGWPQGMERISLNLSSLPSGCYHLELEGSQGIFFRSFLKN